MKDDEAICARALYGGPPARQPSGRPPPRVPLEGRHVRLEPLDPAVHTAELYAASHADDDARRVWDYLPDGPWPDEAAFAGWVAGHAATHARVWYAFRPHVDGRARGMATYLDIEPRAGIIEIGHIWFAPALQRTRAATETLFLLLAHALDALGYRRMQWRCDARNVKSRNAARRLGFRYEGIFYNHMIVKGRNRDTAWYSILGSEWPALRACFETWLDDANFDADGGQRRRLSELTAARPEAPRG